jgi:hypothetical protein
LRGYFRIEDDATEASAGNLTKKHNDDVQEDGAL